MNIGITLKEAYDRSFEFMRKTGHLADTLEVWRAAGSTYPNDIIEKEGIKFDTFGNRR